MSNELETYQNFWCCAHHASAIDNFFEKRTTCEWDCHAQPLQWFHCGKNPMPKSWGSVKVNIPHQYTRAFK